MCGIPGTVGKDGGGLSSGEGFGLHTIRFDDGYWSAHGTDFAYKRPLPDSFSIRLLRRTRGDKMALVE